jgi:hypothetical protein
MHRWRRELVWLIAGRRPALELLARRGFDLLYLVKVGAV